MTTAIDYVPRGRGLPEEKGRGNSQGWGSGRGVS